MIRACSYSTGRFQSAFTHAHNARFQSANASMRRMCTRSILWQYRRGGDVTDLCFGALPRALCGSSTLRIATVCSAFAVLASAYAPVHLGSG